MDRTFVLSGVTLVTPEKRMLNSGLTVSGGQIATLATSPAAHTLDMREHLVFPGLLNAHDHLFGTWWPRVAPNRPYVNVYEWLADYEESPVLLERGRNSIADMYALGAYRNMIAGATLVADHFLRNEDTSLYTEHPIDVLYRYGRTWTMRKPTSWGDDIPTEYQHAVQTGTPYIVHLAEGVDDETAQEMDGLIEHDAVGRCTLIIHGIALRPSDMERLHQVGASVCWCPASNLFLYEQTANVRALVDAGVNVTLGTDSTMTGGLNLLDEVRTGRQAYRQMYGEDPSPQWLVELMTTRAAYALQMEDRRGRIAVGYDADLLVLPDKGEDPYATLIDAEPSDIALLIHSGIPVYGDVAYHDLFEQFTPAFSSVLVSGVPKLVAGDLPALLARVSANATKPVQFPFLPCTPAEGSA